MNNSNFEKIAMQRAIDAIADKPYNKADLSNILKCWLENSHSESTEVKEKIYDSIRLLLWEECNIVL